MTDNSSQNGTDTIRDIDRAGIKTQVVQLDAGGATEKLVSPSLPLPTKVCDTSKTIIQLYATAVASGTTTTETAISLIKTAMGGGAPPAGAASFVVTSGKRFRFTTFTVASRGHATATAQITKFTLRINSAGAVVTGSNTAFTIQTATPATALAYDRLTLNFEGEGPEIVGDGTLQFGLTANSVFVTNAPTWDVLITGYEYTP
jgi:hypothetical protein